MQTAITNRIQFLWYLRQIHTFFIRYTLWSAEWKQHWCERVGRIQDRLVLVRAVKTIEIVQISRYWEDTNPFFRVKHSRSPIDVLTAKFWNNFTRSQRSTSIHVSAYVKNASKIRSRVEENTSIHQSVAAAAVTTHKKVSKQNVKLRSPVRNSHADQFPTNLIFLIRKDCIHQVYLLVSQEIEEEQHTEIVGRRIEFRPELVKIKLGKPEFILFLVEYFLFCTGLNLDQSSRALCEQI